FAKAERLREGVRWLLDDPVAPVALAPNTHELVLRFLSALPLRERPRLVSTDGEFHTLRRQLGRLGEEGLEVMRLSARPVETLAERLAAEAPGASAVLVSAVLFEDSRIVPDLPALGAACEEAGAELLVDAYHALGCLPFTIAGHDRAARVLDFFDDRGLSQERLRASYLHQTGVLAERFDALGLADVTRNRETPLTAFGGFLAVESERAEELSRRLLDVGVVTDSRGRYLRFGPAPYHSDEQLDAAVEHLGRVA